MGTEFDIQENWEETPLLNVLAPFLNCINISKLRGHPNRNDFIYLSDELGYLTLFRWNPLTNSGDQILFDNEPITDDAIHGDFCLHPNQPWIIYTKDDKGDQCHSIYRLDYESGETTCLVSKVGTCFFLLPYDQNSFIAIVNTQKDNQVLLISYTKGIASLLFTTNDQMLSAAVSERHQTAAVSVGRKSSELVFINVPSKKVRNILSETKTSKDTWITIHEETGSFAYVTNSNPDRDEIVVRSINNFEEKYRIAVPGFVGHFIFDLNYVAWVNSNELLVSVVKDGQCSLYLLKLDEETWGDSLVLNSNAYLTQTKDGICWIASDFTFPSAVKKYHKNKITTLINPSIHHPAFDADSVQYTSYDGRLIQGWLMKNSSNPNGKLIVLCHGGPTTAVINTWDDGWAQVLVLAGYHVFQPNFRGSMTFGTEFMNLNIGDVGGGDLQDVLYGAEYVSKSVNLKEKPILMGASYGGYLTLQGLTTQSDAWAGGIAIFPVTDFEAMYHLADAHYRRLSEHLFGGPPKDKSDLYIKSSPITHIKDLNKPVLLVAGKNDPATPYAPIENFYQQAADLDKPVYLLAEDSGHGAGHNDLIMKILINSLSFCEFI